MPPRTLPTSPPTGGCPRLSRRCRCPYVNFLTDAPGDTDISVRAAYGDDVYDRLARLKREFDPTNLFRANHNVRPAR